MKKIYLSFVLLLISIVLNAQVLDRLGQRLEDKAKDRVNRKVEQTIDKGFDKAEEELDDATRKKNKEKKQKKQENESVDAEDAQTNNGSSNDNKTTNSSNTSAQSLKVDSKFDFVPGEKIVLFEDFTKDNIGDFPDKWNTNGSGEVVTLNNAQGRFLESRKETIFYPEWLKNLPDNFTMECDLVATDEFSFYSYPFCIGFTTAKDVSKQWGDYTTYGNGGNNDISFEVAFHPTNAGGDEGLTVFMARSKGNETLKNDISQNQFRSKDNKTKVHVSIWRQKQRVRVYLNDKKIWDLPRAIDASAALSSIYFRNNGASNENDAFYVGNIKVAVGAPDTRNKLITEGKFSTSGILFDVNSDKIKNESYGVLKDIANVLNENADVKVKIIGHTDSDGDDAKNLDLSKRRAASVKSILSKDFNISSDRMTTDGKGETEPIAKNDNAENKAQNRRVEFIKQ